MRAKISDTRGDVKAVRVNFTAVAKYFWSLVGVKIMTSLTLGENDLNCPSKMLFYLELEEKYAIVTTARNKRG